MNNENLPQKKQFFASCPKALENYLLDEVKQHNLSNIEKVIGGVYFESDFISAIKFMINSRIASRVYRKLASFEIKREKDIYAESMKIDWSEVFNLEQTFKIKSVISASPNGKKWSSYKNSMYLSMMVKDAIVDHFQNKNNGLRPDVEKGYSDVSFYVLTHPKNDETELKEVTTVMVDLCGTPLASRGYRTKTVTAPLRENLASALCQTILSENEVKFYMDSMCGSGTSLIEMFMQVNDLPGSYIKILNDEEFAFERLNFFTKNSKLKDDFTKLLGDLNKSINEKIAASTIELWGSDVDKGNLEVAKENIENARLENHIMLKHSDALELQTDQNSGVIFANMPYGERLGDQRELEGLYYEYGEKLKKNFKGFSAYVFTGNMPLLKKISLRTSKKHIFWNAKIECRLAKYDLF